MDICGKHMEQPLYCSYTALEFFLKSISAVRMFTLLKSKYALGSVTILEVSTSSKQHPGETLVKLLIHLGSSVL